MIRPRILWRRLTADRRRFTVMLVLWTVGLLMWGRLLLKNLPRSAVADRPVVVDPTAPPAKPSFELPRPAQVVQVPLSDHSERSIFALRPDEYDQIPQIPVGPPPNLPLQSSEEELKAKLAARVNALKLSTVLMSDRPQALIDGRVYTLGGQPIQGFVIVEISEHRVVLRVRTEDYKVFDFDLKMYRQ